VLKGASDARVSGREGGRGREREREREREIMAGNRCCPSIFVNSNSPPCVESNDNFMHQDYSGRECFDEFFIYYLHGSRRRSVGVVV
jgi:hypothetical protein